MVDNVIPIVDHCCVDDNIKKSRNVVEILLEAGFSVNLRTKSGTALHEAALCGKVEVVKILLKHGINTLIRDCNNYTVMDLLSQFNTAHASQEIINLLKRYKRGLPLTDSDGESQNDPFQHVSNTDSDLGSPYENMRSESKASGIMALNSSPGTSPKIWDCQRLTRPPEGFDDQRVSYVSGISIESDNSVYQVPCAPKQFMDSSYYSEDPNYFSTNRESDQISITSTSSSCGYPIRPDSGGVPLYIPINTSGAGHSPGSTTSKVSPTPPKKPPRRNISVSPTPIQPMSISVDGVGNNPYEYLFMAHSGTRSQGYINDLEKGNRRDRLMHGRSMDQYVEMNIFSIALDEDEPERLRNELQRGKSEDLDSRKKLEPIAITSMYDNMIVKQQNPRRKLRRHQEANDEFNFKRKEKNDQFASSSAPETIHSSKDNEVDKVSQNSFESLPLSPTHYNQPPTPDHPPPSATHAQNMIFEKMRPFKQEYNRRSRDMETETEEEYLLVCDGSSGSISSSVSLSDRSLDNMLDEYNSDTPFGGLIKGSKSKVLELINQNTTVERPKTLKKLKRVYETTTEDYQLDEISSCSEKGFENKENKETSTLSPFDEQEEWSRIQEIMTSFGTGFQRESIFFATELEKEYQSRLMTISCSQTNIKELNRNNSVEKWLQGLGVETYSHNFIDNGFDNLDFLNGVLDENDLKEIGVQSETDRAIIIEAIKCLPVKINSLSSNCKNEENPVKAWLNHINLESYYDTFDKHLYHDMERIKRIWDVELSAVLDIEKIGHRKRILASVSCAEQTIIQISPKLEEIRNEGIALNLRSDIPSRSQISVNTSGDTGTIRHRHKKSRPAPPPPININRNCIPEKKGPIDVHVGGTNSIKSQWRHEPILLITGYVKYTINYLGSTTIKECKGTESSRKSIQKVMSSKERPIEEVVLSVSYKGVKYVNSFTQETICEHEIKNVNCACQDIDRHCYFSYVSTAKNSDLFYCHVFEAASPELAMDIIFTLGQAFELAYQMALRDQVTNKHKSQREHHIPATSPGSMSSHSREFKDTNKTTDIKMNGHPLRMMPLTLSLAVQPSSLDAGSTRKTPTKGPMDNSQT